MEPFIVTGKNKHGSNVTIVGEIHNFIDNSFYEGLALDDSIVMVEHSSVFCNLEPHQVPLFRNARGSEWIWFSRSQAGKPVHCIDRRIEYGFMSRIAELELRSDLDNMNHDDETFFEVLRMVLVCTLNQVKAISNYMDLIQPILSDVKPLLAEIKRHSKSILEVTRLTELDDEIVQHTYEEAVTLHDHLVRIGSIMVDAIILSEIERVERDTYIFVGLNHAFRLAHWLKWDIQTPLTPPLLTLRNNALMTLVSFIN